MRETLGETKETTMSEVIKINIKKLRYLYLIVALIFGLIWLLLLLFFGIFLNQFPNTEIFLFGTLMFLVVGPISISLSLFAFWLIKYKQQSNFFNLLIVSKKATRMFSKKIINEKYKWQFADEIYEFQVNNQKVICLQSQTNFSEIQFNYITKNLNGNEMIGKNMNLKKDSILNMNIQSLISYFE